MLVAQRIVGDIVAGGRRPGDLLPPERSMITEYGTGRGTLREALRLLEFQGVLTLRPGPRGGPVVLDPDASHLAGTLVLVLQLRTAPVRTVVEVRSALEPVTTALAAARMPAAELAELDGTVAAMRTGPAAFPAADQRFHELLARSCGNPLLGHLVDAVLTIVAGTPLDTDLPAPRRVAVLAAHEAIAAAVRGRDGPAAADRMRAHLEDCARHALPAVLDQVLPWTPTGRG